MGCIACYRFTGLACNGLEIEFVLVESEILVRHSPPVTLTVDLILVVIDCVIGCGGTMSEDLARL